MSRRSAASILLLVRTGEEHGVAATTSLAGTGLALPDLLVPGAEVDDEQELAVIGALARARPGHDLALDAGTRYHLTTYGIWGFALASSPTVRSALEVGLRFTDLSFTFCAVSASLAGDELLVTLDDHAVPEPLRDFVVTRDLAGLSTIAGELTGGVVRLRRVSLRTPPPADPTRHRQVLGVEPAFGAPVTVAAVDAGLLDLPLPQADELAAATTEAQCRALVEQRRGRAGTAGAVRDLLVARPGDVPDLAGVAAALSVSERTLRRRLAAEGASYRALVDEVRETLAEELLGAGLGVEQVARRLGYAETASFTHAFTRWKGCSPRAWSRARPRAR